ncbi:MAG: hypothetical protein ACJ77A_01035 [Actinomycetota bacterium]
MLAYESGVVDGIDELLVENYVDHTPPPGFEPSQVELAAGSRMSISTIFAFAMVRALARDHILRRGAGPVTTLGGT